VRRGTKIFRSLQRFLRHARAWGAKKKSNGCFSLTQSSQHERGRLPVLIQPFMDKMRRGNAHVDASQNTFKNIYARFHTAHRMGASQERAAFLTATLLVVTRHRGCIPAGRQADGKFTLPSRFAIYKRPTKFTTSAFYFLF